MKRTLITVVLTSTVLLFLWQLLYPGRYDPKNLHYVAWKIGLLPMDRQRALSTMTHDDALQIVGGKTREQLQQLFGQVLQKQDARPYLVAYCASSRPGREMLFLNQSDWMVVMEHGKVAELILCKG